MKNVIQCRRGLYRAISKFRTEEKGCIAFIGGSITEMNGYTALAEKMIRARLPRCKFNFINAGISSTCSNTGAFRIGRDVFAKDTPDLLFIEFAVNDNQDGHLKPAETIRAMEGMVRQALARNPQMDIVFLYSANESHNESYRNGKTPAEIRAMEKVAKYYGLPSVNFAADVGARLAAGEFDWIKDFGGVHPAPFGNRIYCGHIETLFEKARKQRGNMPEIPAGLMDGNSLVHGCFIDPGTADRDENWEFGIPRWEGLPGEKRERFTSLPTLFTTTPGAELFLEFSGSAIGFFLTAGPDAGTVEYSIDGGGFQSADLYHPYSAGLHYPYTKMLADTLSPGSHTLILRVAEKHHEKSCGNAVRIIAFAENPGTPLKKNTFRVTVRKIKKTESL